MKSAFVLAVILPICYTGVTAQDNESNDELETDQQIRDVTPAGPYPIYIRVMPLFEFQNKDFAAGINYFNRIKSTQLNEFSMGFGYKVDVGIKFRKRLFLEVGYCRATVNAKQNDNRLIVANRYFAARIGYAKTIYYPISVQGYAGFLLGGTQFVVDAADNRSIVNFHGTNWWQDRKGIEGGLRLICTDPAGSGGGLGFVIEANYVHFVDKYSYSPFLSYLDSTNKESFISDPNFWTVSIGIVVPIAIKF